MMSGYDCLNEKRFNSRRKVDSELVATTSVGSVFEMCGAATAKARLPTVDSLTGGTTRRLALVERSVRRSGKSSSKVTWCIAMQNLVRQNSLQLVLNLFRNPQAVQTDDSISYVVEGPQAVDQLSRRVN